MGWIKWIAKKIVDMLRKGKGKAKPKKPATSVPLTRAVREILENQASELRRRIKELLDDFRETGDQWSLDEAKRLREELAGLLDDISGL